MDADTLSAERAATLAGGDLTRPASPHVVLLTEGTYPYVLGGVSSWCHQLLGSLPDVRWTVLPVVAGATVRTPMFDVPDNAVVSDPIELWSLQRPVRRRDGGRSTDEAHDLPASLLRGLMGWDANPFKLVEALLSCGRDPASVRSAFRSRLAWEHYHDALAQLLAQDPVQLEVPFDHLDAAKLYQTLYWVARTAAVPLPDCDVIHLTAAGWAAIPAAIHRARTGTPVMLTEHGLYMREAYLAAILEGVPAGERFVRTRLARGLTRLSYAISDHLTPVSEFNARWEAGHGVSPDIIEVIPNGVVCDTEPTPLPRNRTIVSVGRIDPLKDVLTMLRVAAEVVRYRPDVQFVHYGPVSPGQESYGRACQLLHHRLGLGDRFRFLGPTRTPDAAVRSGDIALLTSISEGMPLAVLEAMAQARPVVATAVGGVPEVVSGCGLLAPPGHDEKLATAICTLLDDPSLAQVLALRGRARVARRFRQDAQMGAYRERLDQLTILRAIRGFRTHRWRATAAPVRDVAS